MLKPLHGLALLGAVYVSCEASTAVEELRRRAARDGTSAHPLPRIDADDGAAI